MIYNPFWVRALRIVVVVVGGILIVVGLILLIISGNAISAINACPEFYSTYTCAPFLGAASRQASFANAYSLLEIGILLAVVGAIVVLFGRVAKRPVS